MELDPATARAALPATVQAVVDGYTAAVRGLDDPDADPVDSLARLWAAREAIAEAELDLLAMAYLGGARLVSSAVTCGFKPATVKKFIADAEAKAEVTG